MGIFDFFKKKKAVAKTQATTVHEFSLPDSQQVKGNKYADFKKKEAQVDSPMQALQQIPALQVEFSYFDKFLAQQEGFKPELSRMLLLDHRNLSLVNLHDLILKYTQQYQVYSENLLHDEQNRDKSRFLSLVQAVDQVFGLALFDRERVFNFKALCVIDFFLNEIFYSNLVTYREHLEYSKQDIEQVLSTHFRNIDPQDFINDYIVPRYEQILEPLITKDFAQAEGKSTEFFTKRLPYLLLVDLVRKTTFLPLTYHELVEEFFKSWLQTPDDVNNFQEMRRNVILQQRALWQLLITQCLAIKAFEYDITGKSYHLDVEALEGFKKSIAQLPNYMFTLLLLARRKVNTSDISLFEKDIELVEQLTFLCESQVDYRKLYFYLKNLGL
ncbi:hypothetical protein [Psittacicella hinzii]|uniref:Uncharacterized protein n=1 Tax=Psittacicella hinzii TaxID=2028575 RepID=A0A3A1YC82_9GAMM|nr:hypothetical protein [Psittacicella hinzii]RIY34780.1 hypothetical protein CKF58_07655 [Psittacicella hinzii]